MQEKIILETMKVKLSYERVILAALKDATLKPKFLTLIRQGKFE